MLHFRSKSGAQPSEETAPRAQGGEKCEHIHSSQLQAFNMCSDHLHYIHPLDSQMAAFRSVKSNNALPSTEGDEVTRCDSYSYWDVISRHLRACLQGRATTSSEMALARETANILETCTTGSARVYHQRRDGSYVHGVRVRA